MVVDPFKQVITLIKVGLVGGRDEILFFETNSWFRMPRDGKRQGVGHDEGSKKVDLDQTVRFAGAR